VVGGIVLAGGRSSRMGQPKASLEWHGSTLLRRVAGVLERSVDGPVVIVRSAGQSLPSLPARYAVVDDILNGRGPLEGLAAGLRSVAGRVELAYVSSTDVPFLHTSFVGAVVGGIGDGDEICVPVIGQRWQPLAAAYRTSVLPVLDELLAADERRVSGLFDRCRVRRLDRDGLLADALLSSGDPDLESVVNINDPAAYRAARARPSPEIAVTSADGRRSLVRAASLGGLIDALAVDDGVRVTVNGVATTADRDFPLQAGDAVAFEQRSQAKLMC
jgi:molybdopterin-guanine dinucleotide biosynthesis protein A